MLRQSKHKGVNSGSKDVTQTQPSPESPTVTLTWNASKYKVHKLHQRYILTYSNSHLACKDAPLVEFVYVVIYSHAIL